MTRCTLRDINRVVGVLHRSRNMGNGDYWLAMLRALTNPDVFVLMPDDESVFLFFGQGFGVYEAHLAVADSKGAVAKGKAAIQWMLANTECELIVAQPEQREVALFAGRCGLAKVNGRYELRRELCHQ